VCVCVFIIHKLVETVICRLFYEAKCASGQLTLLQFRKSGFTQMIKNLTPNIDLNNVGNINKQMINRNNCHFCRHKGIYIAKI
jgi:hypothetical protein